MGGPGGDKNVAGGTTLQQNKFSNEIWVTIWNMKYFHLTKSKFPAKMQQHSSPVTH